MTLQTMGRFIRVAALLAAFLLAVGRIKLVYWLGHVFRPPDDDARSGRRKREGERLRDFFIAAGGTAVKLGQLLATRPEVLPWEYVDPLSGLLDQVPPFPTDRARRIVEGELGDGVEVLFHRFDPEPLASASFAQVYRAALADGSEVAVKVQRPDVGRLVRADIWLVHLAAWWFDMTGWSRQQDARRLAREFEDWTMEELDYRVEARYAERHRLNASDSPDEYFPKVYWNLTTRRVITLEFLDGVWLRPGLAQIAQDGDIPDFDRRAVASRLFHGLLRQAFRDGLFHADLHAGNVVVLRDGRVGYVDFGISGEVGGDFRHRLLLLMRALAAGDIEGIITALLGVADIGSGASVTRYRERMGRLARRWLNATFQPNAPLRERSLGSVLIANLRVGAECGFSYNDANIRCYRAIVATEMLVLRLDETFDIRQEIKDFLQHFTRTEASRAWLDSSFLQYTILQLLAATPILLASLSRRSPEDVRVEWRVDRGRLVLAGTLRALTVPLAAAGGWLAWQSHSLAAGGSVALILISLGLANLLVKSSVVSRTTAR